MNDNLPQLIPSIMPYILWWAKRGVFCQFFKHSKKVIRIKYVGKTPFITEATK